MFKNNHIVYVIVVLSFLLLGNKVVGMAFVIEKAGKAYIRDNHGENWDVTQAMALGFDPHGFEFGIGRHTTQPVDDGGLTANTVF